MDIKLEIWLYWAQLEIKFQMDIELEIGIWSGCNP